jgi:hypothetical protein
MATINVPISLCAFRSFQVYGAGERAHSASGDVHSYGDAPDRSIVCASADDRRGLPVTHNGSSGSPRLLRSLIPGTSIRFVRVRSYDRSGRSIVTVLPGTSR